MKVFDGVVFEHQHSCPLCGGSEFERLLVGDRYDMGLVTVACQGCFFVFTDPYPDSQALESFYQEHYWRVYFKAGSDARTVLSARQEQIESYTEFLRPFLSASNENNSETHFLDLGGGEGLFTRHVKDLQIGKTFLFEPSESEREIAKFEHNADVISNNMEAISAALREVRGEFDSLVVVCTHVLEHVASLDRFFSGLEDVLSDGDVLYIDVPDVLRYDHVKDVHIAHKWHFSVNTLNRLFATKGYRQISIDTYEPVELPKSIRAIFIKSSSASFSTDFELDSPGRLREIFAEVAATERVWNSMYRKFRRFVKFYYNVARS